MGDLQDWLDRVNARWGGIGAVVTTTICLVVLLYGLWAILHDLW